LTGDAERPVEEVLLAAGGPGACDILKVGHHGSRTSTTTPFLRQVRPRYAGISVGRANPWGHPHPEVLQALRLAGSRTFRTDQHGMITLETDGNWIRWAVSELAMESDGGWRAAPSHAPRGRNEDGGS
jgi:competence protein ComEC